MYSDNYNVRMETLTNLPCYKEWLRKNGQPNFRDFFFSVERLMFFNVREPVSAKVQHKFEYCLDVA